MSPHDDPKRLRQAFQSLELELAEVKADAKRAAARAQEAVDYAKGEVNDLRDKAVAVNLQLDNLQEQIDALTKRLDASEGIATAEED